MKIYCILGILFFLPAYTIAVTKPDTSSTNPEISSTNPNTSNTNPNTLSTNPEISSTNLNISSTNLNISNTNPEISSTSLNTSNTKPEISSTNPNTSNTNLVNSNIQTDIAHVEQKEDFEFPLNNFSIELKNSFTLQKNNLLTKPYDWSLSMPFTKIELTYPIKQKDFFTLELEFSYQQNNLEIEIENLSFQNNFLFYISFGLQWGYFDVSYIQSNSFVFNKEPLLEEVLFPNGDEALGLSLQTHFNKEISLLIAAQSNYFSRETDKFNKFSPLAIVSTHLLFNKYDQNLFLGFIKQDLFLEGDMSSFGTGANLKISYKNFLLKLKTEVWEIKKSQPQSRIFTYYLLPYFKWNNFIGAGFLVGSLTEQIHKQQSSQFEVISKFDIYFSRFSHFSIEHVQEYSSIFTEHSWNFLIKTKLNL